MNKKGIIKIIIYFVIVLGGLILAENALRGVSRVTETIKTRRQIKKEEKAYQQTEEYQTEIFIDSSVQEAIDLLNLRDYNTLYDLLDEDYKNYKAFESVEDFKSFLNSYIGSDVSATLMNYTTIGKKYRCNVAITSGSGIETYTILVNPMQDGTFRIIFDDIVSIENVLGDYEYSNASIGASVHYIVMDSQTVTYVVDIENRTDTKIEGSFTNSLLTKSNRKELSPLNDVSSIEVAPHAIQRVDFTFYDRSVRHFEDSMLELAFQSKDEKSSLSLPIVLEIEY